MSDVYQTMAADPPWPERGGGQSKRGADAHYPVENVRDILPIMIQSGEFRPDTRGCSLWMWATANYLEGALWLMRQLGFVPVTGVVWIKAVKEYACCECGSYEVDPWAAGGFQCWTCQRRVPSVVEYVRPQAAGLGQRVRMCHEHLLFGRMGRVAVPAPANRLPSVVYAPDPVPPELDVGPEGADGVIYAPRTRHSEKPVEAYDLIERHDGPGNRLEMFARTGRQGWTVWGNEVSQEAEHA